MNYLKWGRSPGSAADTGSGSKRSADTMQSLPASAPALKLHKDDSGDVVTAATVTAEVPTDPATTVPAAPALVQIPKAVWEAVTAGLEAVTTRVRAVEQETAQLRKQLAGSTQNTLARENALKDTHRQELASLKDDVEFRSQRIRSKNMVLHGVPDTAAVSKPADLERFVKLKLDEATPNRGAPRPSQSITAVTHIGKPGAGNRSVLVEYASSQAKHSTYALSRELRRRGFYLADELTPKQMHIQKAMEADASALRSKEFRPWFRRGALYYSNRGVQRQCRQGEAVKLPTCSAPPRRLHQQLPHAMLLGGALLTGRAMACKHLSTVCRAAPDLLAQQAPHMHRPLAVTQLHQLHPLLHQLLLPLGHPPLNRGLPANNDEANAWSHFWYGMCQASRRSLQFCMRPGSTLRN